METKQSQTLNQFEKSPHSNSIHLLCVDKEKNVLNRQQKKKEIDSCVFSVTTMTKELCQSHLIY